MNVPELIARERVRDTVAAYNHSGDSMKLEDLAACFTEDGVLEVKGRFVATGRTDIVARLTAGVESRRETNPASETGKKVFIRHFVASLRFDAVTDHRIDVSSYFAGMTADGLDHRGRYRDVFVPVRDRWLIAHRKVALDVAQEGSIHAL